MPGVYMLTGKINREKFNRAIQGIIRRHETLRTSIHLINGEAVQRISLHQEFHWHDEKIDMAEDPGKRIKEFVKPYDLSMAPLLRINILNLTEERQYLFFDMHHIISDGISMEILVRNFLHLYENKSLSALTFQYKDYATWQNKWLNKEKLRNQEKYWLKKLDGFVFTQLPPDHFDSYHQVEGKFEHRKIEKSLHDKIKKFCNQQDVTRFVFMVSVFGIILAREIDQVDITIGIPVSIRENSGLNNLIGIFLNVLLIRSIIDEDDPFVNHLAKCKETVLEALYHHSYPYEMLAYKIKDFVSLNQSELFSILLNYFPVTGKEKIATDDFTIHSVEIREVAPKYDMTLYIADNDEAMDLTVVYKGNLYDRYSISGLLDSLLMVIPPILEDCEATINRLTDGDEEENDFSSGEFEEYDRQ
jgi:hypothetical protein